MENIELKNRISNELLISLNLERLKTGESNISWYVYDIAECKYIELDNPSGRENEVFSSLEDMVEKMLNDALA